MAGYIGSKSSVTQVDGYTEAEADAEFVTKTGDTMTGNLDVTGTVTSDGLTSTGSGANTTYFIGGSNTVSGRQLTLSCESQGGQDNATHRLTVPSGYGHFAVTMGASERMRIDSSGNVLVGKTSADFGTAGMQFLSSGLTQLTATGQPLYLNRLGSNGTIADFRKDGSTIGSIGTNGGSSRLTISGAVSGLYFGGGDILPTNSSGTPNDNAVDLGSSGVRWDDVYATNGTINTSDFNDKQDIASLTATEMLVGKRISALFKTFRWKDSVAEKGDNARTHTGVIAQDVQAAFTAEGLDAGDYALFISDTWWEHDVDVPAVEAVAEVTDEDGNVTTEAVEAKDAYTRTDTYDTEAEAPEGATEKTRLGIRYPELLSFVAAYNEQRFASIEARLTALEA